MTPTNDPTQWRLGWRDQIEQALERRCVRCETWSPWSGLAIVGHMQDEVSLIELRNCACGNTLALSVYELEE